MKRPDPADLAYFRERLEDPTLLGRAVVVEGLLAVPVGGRRRGGHVSLSDAESAGRASALLAGLGGFPRPRYEFSSVPDDESGQAEEYHIVLWGEDPPEEPARWSDAAERAYDIASGRFYGYSEAAILRFLRRRRS